VGVRQDGSGTSNASTGVQIVDLGARRIGLALSDPSRTVATPHEVLRRSGDPAADRRAIELTANPSERALLEARLDPTAIRAIGANNN